MRAASLLFVLLAACSNKNEASTSDGPGGGDGGDDPPPPAPLELGLDAPADATFTTDSSVAVSGWVRGGVAPVLTVNGDGVPLTGEDFSASSARDAAGLDGSPVWPVLAEATDAETGEWLRARATVIQGESADAADPMDGALVLRLTDRALLSLGPVIDGLVAETDFSTLFPADTPVAEFLGIGVYVSDLSIGGIAADLDFTPAGLLADITATDLSAQLTLDFGIFGDTGGTLTVEALDIQSTLLFEALGGALVVTPTATEVAITNLGYAGFSDPTGLLDDVLNAFVGDTLANAVQDALVDALGGFLSFQDSVRSLSFSGVVLASDFTNVAHDADGVTLTARTAVEVEGGAALPRRLSNPGPTPAPLGQASASGVDYGLALMLDDDLLSALGAGLMAAGLLNQEISGDLGSLSLDTSLLGGLIAGFDTLPAGLPVTLSTRPTAPLVATAGGAEGEAARLHAGGLFIDFLVDAENDGAPDPVMTVAVDAVIGVSSTAEELLTVALADSAASLVSTSLGSTPAEVEPGLASLITLAVPLLVGDLLGEALTLDLPVSITPVDAGAAGSAGDRAALYLDLGAPVAE